MPDWEPHPRSDAERNEIVLHELRSAVIDMHEIIKALVEENPNFLPKTLTPHFVGLEKSVEILKRL